MNCNFCRVWYVYKLLKRETTISADPAERNFPTPYFQSSYFEVRTGVVPFFEPITLNFSLLKAGASTRPGSFLKAFAVRLAGPDLGQVKSSSCHSRQFRLLRQ